MDNKFRSINNERTFRLFEKPQLKYKFTVILNRWSIYFKVLALSHMYNMHYTSFSALQNISHDWNRIQTRPSVTYVTLTCQFSNAKFYEYFMEQHSLSFFHALCELSHQIGVSPALYRSYEPQLLHFSVIDSHLMFKLIILSLFLLKSLRSFICVCSHVTNVWLLQKLGLYS